VPGALSWSIIIGACVFSFIKPLATALVMIIFLLYWVLRLIYMNIFLIISYGRLSVEKDTDWMSYIEAVDNHSGGAAGLCHPQRYKNIKSRISSAIHCKQLENLKKTGSMPPKSKDIYHLVVVTVVKETKDIVEPCIAAIKNGVYPAERILVAIALESRANENVKRDMEDLRKKYASHFFDLMVVMHPAGLPGEAAVKGANATCAARQAAEYFKSEKIPYENIIVSCFDADTVSRPDYFSCLTYYFMITPDRARASFQPIPVYYNNIWEVPSFARIIDIGTSFFELVEATNPSKLVTFSSHSMSFKALVDVGYWPVNLISDDSAIFWKAFIYYDGNYQTVPIYTTVSMDIAQGKNSLETFVSIYKQKRRWAWGVENFPIVLRAFLKSKNIPVYKRINFSYKLLDSFVSWATWSFLLAFLSWLPAVFAGREFATSTVYYIAPRIRGTVFSLAFVGILICMAISLLLLPARGEKNRTWQAITHVFEWLSIPVVILVLSALPALDAQTRLMSARYMEFWVTDKHRTK
jgi:hypothetical protein